jgi:cellulose synthase/poly-beta-1,6-N-acetylglucosamine synthase-like glycosyltransferase
MLLHKHLATSEYYSKLISAVCLPPCGLLFYIDICGMTRYLITIIHKPLLYVPCYTDLNISVFFSCQLLPSKVWLGYGLLTSKWALFPRYWFIQIVVQHLAYSQASVTHTAQLIGQDRLFSFVCFCKLIWLMTRDGKSSSQSKFTL